MKSRCQQVLLEPVGTMSDRSSPGIFVGSLAFSMIAFEETTLVISQEVWNHLASLEDATS